MFVSLSVCLYRRISLTTEPIEFSSTGKLLIGPGTILGESTTTLPREIAPRKKLPPPNFFFKFFLKKKEGGCLFFPQKTQRAQAPPPPPLMFFLLNSCLTLRGCNLWCPNPCQTIMHFKGKH